MLPEYDLYVKDYDQEMLDFLGEKYNITDNEKDLPRLDQYCIRYSKYRKQFWTAPDPEDIYNYGKLVTKNQFKGLVGMKELNKNTMPELVAGKHFVKFEDGRYGMVMDGYHIYVLPHKTFGSFNYMTFEGWDYTGSRVLNGNPIVEIYEPMQKNGANTSLEDFESGQYTVWKKEDEKKQKIKEELELAKAKMVRLKSHINVLESKI